jgi:predicted flap endonuclease-1-like 5' DNA nuclease
MLHCALPVFLLMSGATLLGGWLAWLWARKTYVDHSDELSQMKLQLSNQKEEMDRMLEYSSNFHSEKRMLIEENKTLHERTRALEGALTKLHKDKMLLHSELKRVSEELEQRKGKQDVFFDEGMELMVEAGQATDNSQVNEEVIEKQVQMIQEELLQWKAKYEALRDNLSKKERRIMELDELAKTDELKTKSKKWELKYKKLKLKTLTLIKERDDALAELDTLKTANDQLLDELLKLKSAELLALEINNPKEEVFDRIKKRKNLLDFHRIGKYHPKQKDDLKKISGVGPFIEKKLNALGIYKFEQLAKLTDEDINQIIKIIEVPPGIIKGADWIEQAKNMK